MEFETTANYTIEREKKHEEGIAICDLKSDHYCKVAPCRFCENSGDPNNNSRPTDDPSSLHLSPNTSDVNILVLDKPAEPFGEIVRPPTTNQVSDSLTKSNRTALNQLPWRPLRARFPDLGTILLGFLAFAVFIWACLFIYRCLTYPKCSWITQKLSPDQIKCKILK